MKPVKVRETVRSAYLYMNDKLFSSSWSARVGVTIRYSITVGCLWLIMFWQGEEPPVLDMSQMRVTEGVYQCILHTGGKYGPTGPDIVDGVEYYRQFSYIFGIIASTPCTTELNGHIVRMYYLLPNNSNRRFALELIDLKSGRTVGATKNRRFAIYQHDVADKSWLYLSKLGLLLLALRLIFWGKLKNFLNFFLNRRG